MSVPLASKTTVSSRNKMAALASIGEPRIHPNNNNHLNNDDRTSVATTTTSTTSRIPPRTSIKPTVTRHERTQAALAATSSRIALPRSRLSANSASSTTSTLIKPTRIVPTNNRTTHIGSAQGHLDPSLASRSSINRTTLKTDPSATITTIGASANIGTCGGAPSFANSRSSSKVSSISSSVTNNHNNYPSRQSSLSNAQTTVKKQTTVGSSKTNYIPDTNAIRRGLAKFSNPIECQRQFQALNSNIRQLTEINEVKDKTISKLRDQLKVTLDYGAGYATVVQYFANKLKIDSEIDLEKECEQLKSRVETLMVSEREFEDKLKSIVADYENRLLAEQDLRARLKLEYDQATESHSEELGRLKELHKNELKDSEEVYSIVKNDLESRIEALETELATRTKDLSELRKEHELLNTSFNKLEESLTKDKDARVKYAQEKVNQLQKDVDSLNAVLEMKTERIHALERDSILLGEVQQDLMSSKDQNKALKQQLESLNAALENKRLQFENILADHEKVVLELKRERKERRRMTMRTEQLEYVLNESCATENNLTVLDSSLET